MKHTMQSLESVAAALIVAYGHEYLEHWQIGHESNYIIFHSHKDNKTYSLEFWDEDQSLGVRVMEGHARRIFEGDEPDERNEIWELELEGTNVSDNLLFSEDLFRDSAPHHLWAIGALTAFLYDLREGKVK